MYAICDNGPYDAQGDGRSAGTTPSLAYQPEAMRWRGLTVLTNTPPKTSQRAPGGMQGVGIFEPILTKAAQETRHRSGRAPHDQRSGRQGAVRTGAAKRQAGLRDQRLRQGSARPGVAKSSSGTRRRRPIAASVRATRRAASASRSARSRAARSASTVSSSSSRTAASSSSRASATTALTPSSTFIVRRRRCSVSHGNSATSCSAIPSKNLPWTSISAGSQTAHAMTRAAHAAANDAIKKLQEIAAKAHGGSPEAYKVAGGKVTGPGGTMTFAQAAQKAIELRRQVRRPRAAGRRQQLHQDVGEEPRRPRA